MAWTWRLESESGEPVTGIDVPEFESQGDAETWVGDEWQGLLEQGVDSVSLLEGDRVEYSGMSLHPPQ
ncbi:hypothetical protein EK0264_02215 [Epidermidibacterium keratini]|uniref:DUF2188 domain-containing protein n=1 Tax=Epidermidibacterium keratini TaxID=1891644 RepID=A0A7L4YK88_9ACTN|nr:hypothetical protein [Epidermidibacterium keratini]QHB99218.1 hypothetical protein EK0264_02215 [Epidermidibacterium keratini]